jgi:hypothetical protein
MELIETILLKVFSENWLIWGLLVGLIILIWLILKWFLTQFLKQMKDRDDSFLKKLSDIVSWVSTHSNEHKDIKRVADEVLEVSKKIKEDVLILKNK